MSNDIWVVALVLAAAVVNSVLWPLWQQRCVPYVKNIASIGLLSAAVITWQSDLSGVTEAIILTLLAITQVVVLVQDHQKEKLAEWHALMLLSVIGGCVVVASDDIITALVALELLYLPLYGLVALRRSTPQVAEAAVKYFMQGAIASVLMWYGVSLLYILTGQIELTAMAEAAAKLAGQSVSVWQTVCLLVGLSALTSGMLFKLGVMPFHGWVIDIYATAEPAVTMLIITLPKPVVTWLAYRLLIPAVAPWPYLAQDSLALLGVVSLLFGALGALYQQPIRHVLGYSSIAQMGIVVVLWATGASSMATAQSYVLVYALTTILALVLLSAWPGKRGVVVELTGVALSSPGYALAWLLVWLSFAGIPLTAGFMVKANAIIAMVTAQMLPLAVVIMLVSLASVAYALAVLRQMLFEAAEQRQTDVVVLPWHVSLLALLILWWGIAPQSLLQWFI